MPRAELRPASPAHIKRIALRMRDIDRIECEAKGRAPAHALRTSLAASSFALTALLDGSPHAMLGVAPKSLADGTGTPWMLGTEEVYSHGRELLLYGERIVREMQHRFRRLENVISADNRRGIRLLRRLGFTVEDQPHMVQGIEFVPFWRE